MFVVPPLRRVACAFAVCGTLALAACTAPKRTPFQTEQFATDTTYSRSFHASAADTCEAARRALLSQGYVVMLANSELVNARKSFQADSGHVEIEFRVVCAAERRGTGSTLAFATALQDGYALKKSNNSASVGVGAIGSLSLPFISSDDSLVKVSSETVTAAPFYDRYFRLLTQYLGTGEVEMPAAPGAPAGSASAPQMAAAASAASAVTVAPAASAASAVPVIGAASAPAASSAAASAASAAADAARP